MPYLLKEDPSAHVLALEGCFLGAHEKDSLVARVDNLLKEGYRSFVVDLAEVRLIDAEGIKLLQRIVQRVRGTGGALRVRVYGEDPAPGQV